jgi:hypothetical protein
MTKTTLLTSHLSEIIRTTVLPPVLTPPLATTTTTKTFLPLRRITAGSSARKSRHRVRQRLLVGILLRLSKLTLTTTTNHALLTVDLPLLSVDCRAHHVVSSRRHLMGCSTTSPTHQVCWKSILQGRTWTRRMLSVWYLRVSTLTLLST